MNRGGPVSGIDTDSLQADVMRFMAIIGFCLVAVFALVRNTHPVPDAPSPKPVAAKAPVQPKAVTARKPPAVPVERQAPREPAPEVVAAEPPQRVPEPSPAPAPPIEVPITAPAPEPGLSLSFASDRDFMRLLGAGTIELYVLQPTGDRTTLRFDPQRNFVRADAPGEIYELLPETIPDVIVTALAAEDSATTWGVTLPPTLERAIASERSRHESGILLIDRYARVRHVPAA